MVIAVASGASNILKKISVIGNQARRMLQASAFGTP
jgi:hypothetical protein